MAKRAAGSGEENGDGGWQGTAVRIARSSAVVRVDAIDLVDVSSMTDEYDASLAREGRRDERTDGEKGRQGG